VKANARLYKTLAQAQNRSITGPNARCAFPVAPLQAVIYFATVRLTVSTRVVYRSNIGKDDMAPDQGRTPLPKLETEGLIDLQLVFRRSGRISRLIRCLVRDHGLAADFLLTSFDCIQALAEPGFFRPLPVLTQIGVCA
jgi:hypothetical protein